MKKILILLPILIVILLIAGGFWWWKTGQGEIVSPWLGKKIQEERGDFRMFGFLPTWEVGKTKEYGGEVSDLVFLGVDADGEGNLIWDNQSKKINNPEYLKLKERIKQTKGRNILGIKMFKDKESDKLLASIEAQNQLIEQIKAVVVSGGFDGVNMDFEYMRDPTVVTEDLFGGFLERLKAAEVGEISLDVMGNTIIRSGYERLIRLLSRVDYLIVMGYDFHQPSSDFVGPVAPLEAPTGERSLKEVMEKVVASGMDRSKVVVALPLYGYQWKTVDSSFGAQAKDYVGMITYQRMAEFMADPTFLLTKNQGWDEMSATPWLSFTKDETVYYTERVKVGRKYKTVTKSKVVTTNHQVYYEDTKSLKIKLAAVKEAKMGGTGFWALGYDDEGGEVWRVVGEVMKEK